MAGHKGATPKSHEEAERKTKRDPGVAVQVPAPAGGRAATATVLGGGSWGTALAHLVAQGGHRVNLWMRSPERVMEINTAHTNLRYLQDRAIHPGVVATTDLQRSVAQAEVIIVAIPSSEFRSVTYEFSPFVTGDQILLSATKGFEPARLTRMSEVLREETCCRKIGAISGPNLADEVMANQPSATVVASLMDEVIEKTAALLAGPTFRVYGNHDLVGVEVMGALKNIIAIAAGVTQGMGYGQNALAMLMTRGLSEMSRFGAALGSDQLTALGLAGLGDLIATCNSPLSRNNTLGRKIAAGQSLAEAQADAVKVAEGVRTTQATVEHAQRLGVDMPIARAVHALLFDGARPEAALSELMARENRYEHTEVPIEAPVSFDGSVVDTAHAALARSRGW